MSYNCPVCKGKTFNRWRNNLQICSRCSLVVDKNRDEGVENKDLNNNFFEENFITRINRFSCFYQKKNAIRAFKNIVRHIKLEKNDPIIEIGPGDGSLVSLFKKKGFVNVEACDISQSIASHIEKTTGVKVLPALPENKKYTLIVMRHVLEHMDHPDLFLQSVSSALHEDGIAYISVPNIASFDALFSGWNSYEPYHLYYFSPKTLNTLISQNNFSTITTSTFEGFSPLLLALYRTMKKRFFCRRHSATDVRQSPAKPSTLKTVLSFTFYYLSFLLIPWRTAISKAGYGDEIIVIAKKRHS